MTLTMSAASMAAFRQRADDQLAEAIAGWARAQMAWALDTDDSATLVARVHATVKYGRGKGLEQPNDLAWLFGALCVQGAEFAGNAQFVDALATLQGAERRALLYDLLTGSTAPDMQVGRDSGAWDDLER